MMVGPCFQCLFDGAVEEDGEPGVAFARYDDGSLVPLCEGHVGAAARFTDVLSLEDGHDEYLVQSVMGG